MRLRFLPQALEVEVEDHGKGFDARAAKQGIGLVAMRERAELMGGRGRVLAARAKWKRKRNAGSITSAKREAGFACRIRFQFCWLTITPWCAEDSAAFWKMNRILSVVGEAGDGLEAVKLAR